MAAKTCPSSLAGSANLIHAAHDLFAWNAVFDDADRACGAPAQARAAPAALPGISHICLVRPFGVEDNGACRAVLQMVHDAERGTFVFEEGALPRAMRAGVPLLLDEINFGDQAIIARLQNVLLKRPGEAVYLQEEGVSLTVQPGFTVFATANEASKRYRHREILDPAIRDRFEILERTYPDLDRDPLAKPSPSLTRLALSEAIDDDGIMSRHIDRELLNALVHLATITEYLYAAPAKDAVVKLDDGATSSSAREDANPLMTDCITPRSLNRAVQDSAGGNLPGRHLDLYLIEKMLRTLDQAGSHRNADIARQAALLAGIDLYPRDGER